MMASRATEVSTWRCRCRCGACYDARAFLGLPSRHVLDEAELAPIVVRWPAGVVVDVRVCATCGHGLARLQRAT